MAQEVQYSSPSQKSSTSSNPILFQDQVQIFKGRNCGATWLEYSIALKFAEWLCVECYHWCIGCIEELSQYGYVDASEYANSNEEISAEAPSANSLEEAQGLIERQWKEIRQLNERINTDRSKVEFYNELIENRDWFRSSRIADELGCLCAALFLSLNSQQQIRMPCEMR